MGFLCVVGNVGNHTIGFILIKKDGSITNGIFEVSEE